MKEEIKEDKSKKVESAIEFAKSQIAQTEQRISDETKKLTDRKATSEQINKRMQEVYKAEIQILSGIKLNSENAVLLIEKIRDLKERVFTIETKGLNKEQIKQYIKNKNEKKKNRNLFDLFTSATVRNRNVWIPISLETLIANERILEKDSVGIQNISDILNNNTTSSYIHTLTSKSGIELVQKTRGAGFKSIKSRTPEELLNSMTDEQKEAIAKLIAGK